VFYGLHAGDSDADAELSKARIVNSRIIGQLLGISNDRGHPNNAFSSIRQHDSVADEEDHAALRSFFDFAHLARCAAAIFLRAAGDIVRALRAAISTIFCPLTFAQRARCAAAIFRRADADMGFLARFGRAPLKLPFKLPRADRAASNS